MAVTEIIAADFSSHGDWLSTVEMWDDKVMSPEMRLKFWNSKKKRKGKSCLAMPNIITVTLDLTCLDIYVWN